LSDKSLLVLIVGTRAVFCFGRKDFRVSGKALRASRNDLKVSEVVSRKALKDSG